jgi:hypothetical protein
MCNHDALYQTENAANGGIGCPVCNAGNRAAIQGAAVAKLFGQRVALDALLQVRPTAVAGCRLGQCVTCRVPAEDCVELAKAAYIEMRGDAGNDPAIYSPG